ncbi:NPCBM/NEW2 domain-containing protein [Amycolatopsis sp. CA-230715]|uniref:NPCBM/NEW2 domain-containing protein n=1 Tax=Amycolatopsis sp. CA-230715 TaxID=2745196 RepID=UPI001C02E2FC|nr:NPCBM/NEW2 domain-containing protein [Amycolatopsis sp. CA-230715]QWF82389.1 hypothetical protein HUW46_05826 [Amycolatopsis sp. CA-230715]
MRRFAAALVVATAAATAFTAPALATPAPEPPGKTLGASPPMAWNSWNKFGCDINEQLIRETADAMVGSGLRDAGYQYLNLDDCWAESDRDAAGKLVPSAKHFPSGIKALADYVHGKGLKLGIYTSAGTRTCADTMPGALDHEKDDAQSFADWGVDYLKYDNCNNQGRPATERYKAMGDALKATGRPIVYALCEWGENKPWEWGRDVGAQLWRTTGDISDNWASMTGILDKQVGLEAYSGPSAWNDPDMLEVGNGGMTTDEYRAHFALWALMNAPLIAGNDVRSMDDATKKILLNKDLIAVDQDWGGKQGHKVRDDGDTEVWAKPMSDGSAAMVLFNRGSAAATMTSSAAEAGLGQSPDYRLRDLFSGAESETTGTIRAAVPPHGAAVYRVWPQRFPLAAPHGTLSLRAPEFADKTRPFTTTLTLANDGRTPLLAGSVRLAVPEGWAADASTEAFVPVVAPGKSWQRSWTLRPKAPAGEKIALSAKTRYATVWGDRELTATTTSTVATAPSPGITALSKAAWVSAENGYGPVERGTSNGEDKAGDGHRMVIGGTAYDDGLGVHAPSRVRFYLGGKCTSFSSAAGVDMEKAKGSVAFGVLGDGKRLAGTGVLRAGQPAQALEADLAGVQVLELAVTDGGDGVDSDHADWANARITC